MTASLGMESEGMEAYTSLLEKQKHLCMCTHKQTCVSFLYQNKGR
jgi:hypothetical protein